MSEQNPTGDSSPISRERFYSLTRDLFRDSLRDAERLLTNISLEYLQGTGARPRRAGLLSRVLLECVYQDVKWGSKSARDPFVWVTILLEEVGEVAREALELRWDTGGETGKPDDDPERFRRLVQELVEVAATCVAAAESLSRSEWSWGSHRLPEDANHGFTPPTPK